MALTARIEAQLALHRRLYASCLVLSVVVTLLSACATVRSVDVAAPALNEPDAAVQIDDVDVLAVSAEMEDFLERYILPHKSLETRLNLLTLAVMDNGYLGFKYDDTRTYTASVAFSTRSGNCVSHANMLVALARRAGLDAHYQEVVIQPQWSSRDDTVLINKHLNVVLSSPHTSYQVDISGRAAGPDWHRRMLSDADGKAMYFNNLGVMALIENDLPGAYGHMVRAIESSPQVPDSWINLGVVFVRNNQFPEAELAYRTALKIDGNELSAMNNLHGVFLRQGRIAEAEKLQRRVDRHRRKNPYYLLVLSREALDQSRIDDAIRLLKRAVKLKDDDHQLHFALARAQYLSGNRAAAESSFGRARELAPEDYSLPLDQLIRYE